MTIGEAMQTDPISAAVFYHQQLTAILTSTTHNEARQLAAKGLEVQFDRPRAESINVTSGFGVKTNTPFVTLASSAPVVQIDTLTARAHAVSILEACDAAESDGFVISWLRGRDLDLSDSQLGALLQDFRQYRAHVREANEERNATDY